MRKADVIRAAMLIGLVAATAGCETTWRRSSLHHVQMDGRELTVSWIRLQPDEIETVVWEDPAFRGVTAEPNQRLGRVAAARAADQVVDQLCSAGFVVAPVVAASADGRHAFRYTCLKGR